MQGGHAAKLYIPESAAEIAKIVREANETETPVTISGARTGTVGGAIPFGGYVISLEKLNKINIDKDLRTATVGSGVILADLQKAVDWGAALAALKHTIPGDFAWVSAAEVESAIRGEGVRVAR